MTVPLVSLPIDDSLKAACQRIAELSRPVSAENVWPGPQLDILRETDTLRLGIPAEYGGVPETKNDILLHYLALSQACLLTCFVLTQRNAAVQRVACSSNDSLKQSLLPRLARGEMFATVGISHLTTSRQYLKQPIVTAEPASAGNYLMRGEVPWVSGASHADVIVTGGVLTNGDQLLVALPTNHHGVQIHPSAQLLALTGSATSSVSLENVTLAADQFLFPPTPQVLKKTGGGAGGLSTTTLALGLSRAALEFLQQETLRRPELEPAVDPLVMECNALVKELLEAAGKSDLPPQQTDTMRGQANSLVLRTTQAVMIASKGAGYVQGHPAERWIRQAASS
ncbi:MAG: acyl-CoA dehydrogenase family protein [Planctomycetales bacterium]